MGMDRNDVNKPFEISPIQRKQVLNSVDFQYGRNVSIVDLHPAHLIGKHQILPYRRNIVSLRQ